MNVFNPRRALSKRMHSSSEELANIISHGIGLIAALIGAPILLLAARETGSGGFFVGTIIFVAAMLTLYLASMLYHAWPETRTKYALQLFDHSAIFFLNRGHLHAIRPWSASRHLGVDDPRSGLGSCGFRRNCKGDARDVAPSQTSYVSLSRDGLVRVDHCATSDPERSTNRIGLVIRGWYCVYRRRAVFCERTPAV